MKGIEPLPTTKKRHERIFNSYLQLLKDEYEKDPEKAMSLDKSYYYRIIADEFGYTPHMIGRIVQVGLRESGSPPSRTKKAINREDMDPQVRFILGLDDEEPQGNN